MVKVGEVFLDIQREQLESSHTAPGNGGSHTAGPHSVKNRLFQKPVKSELQPLMTATWVLEAKLVGVSETFKYGRKTQARMASKQKACHYSPH